jgi:hypothetical protein
MVSAVVNIPLVGPILLLQMLINVQQTINVTVKPSNTLTNFDWTVTAFSNNQVVTISPTAANGDYSYKLDDGPFKRVLFLSLSVAIIPLLCLKIMDVAIQ